MKKIIKYEAYDGTIFNTKKSCIEYENLCLEIKKLEDRLPTIPENFFSNGGGFIQHNEKTFMEVRVAVLKIAQRFSNHKWLQQAIDEGLTVHHSWPGRIINDSCPKAVNDIWYRISSTTNDFKEYGQPYYREFPEKAKNIQLN